MWGGWSESKFIGLMGSNKVVYKASGGTRSNQLVPSFTNFFFAHQVYQTISTLRSVAIHQLQIPYKGLHTAKMC